MNVGSKIKSIARSIVKSISKSKAEVKPNLKLKIKAKTGQIEKVKLIQIMIKRPDHDVVVAESLITSRNPEVLKVIRSLILRLKRRRVDTKTRLLAVV